MAPLPESNTARWFLDYSDGINEHSMMFRTVSPASMATLKSEVDTFLDTMAPQMFVITIIGMRVALVGSNVSNSTPWTGNATYGTGVMPATLAPREVRFVGRSADGRRNSISVYGTKFVTPDTFRIPSSADTVIEAALLRLANAAALGIGATISGQAPIWKAYANVNFNSYWESEARP